jgi:hypothetical protein
MVGSERRECRSGGSFVTRRQFEHHFEGGEVLQGLLEVAGSPLTAEEVLGRMQKAHASGMSSQQVIPTLFHGEPRFPDPSLARRLYQNLLGLWDLVESGKPIRLEGQSPPKRLSKPVPTPPPPFGAKGPTLEFVETAWRYLEDLDKGSRDRLQHLFENQQDALLSFLEEPKLSDNAVDCARLLLFELFAMIELGWPAGTRSVARKDLQSSRDATVPGALEAYVDDALLEAELDDQAPLSKEEAATVRGWVMQALRALWNARR